MYTEQEFNEIYKMYAQELFNISFGYTHNKNDSEDIIQQVFMKFLNNKKTFDSLTDIKYWLIRVTINQSIDYIKTYYKKNIVLSDEVIYSYINNDNRNDTKYINYLKYINLLPEKDKKIIILYYYDDLSVLEISNILRLSETSVSKRLQRARTKLKKLIGVDKDG